MLDSSAAVEVLRLPAGFSPEELTNFVYAVYEMGASDLKFSSNDFVWADINRKWTRVTERRLDSFEIEAAMRVFTTPASLALINSGKPVDERVDLAKDAHTIREFRLNATGVMVAGVREGINITMRSIPVDIPTLGQLGIESDIVDNIFPRYGLVLVVGTTGSGKSTLLAAANRYRLEERRHDPVAIMTFEDPIEYSLKGLAQGYMPEPVQSGVGLGRHIESFELVSPNAMRRRGDVIVMGEIRDRNSAHTGCELSETGHATYATMHVETPAEAIGRLIKFYPPDQQESAAHSLLGQLRLVVAQKLARTVDGKKIAFRSWLVFDRQVRGQLEDLPVARWSRAISNIVQERGQDFLKAALTAYAAGRISLETLREVGNLTAAEARDVLAKAGLSMESQKEAA